MDEGASTFGGGEKFSELKSDEHSILNKSIGKDSERNIEPKSAAITFKRLVSDPQNLRDQDMMEQSQSSKGSADRVGLSRVLFTGVDQLEPHYDGVANKNSGDIPSSDKIPSEDDDLPDMF